MAKPQRNISTAAEVDRLLAKYPNPRDVRYAPTLERTGSPLREASPELYGFLGGAMGTAPDQFEGSVLDPLSARVKSGAAYGFPIGTALNVAPLIPAALKGTVGALTRVANAGSGPLAGSLAAQRGVIKAPGGNWLSGSVEDALKGLRNRGVDDLAALPDGNYHDPIGGRTVYLEDAPTVPQSKALNSFIDKQLTRYVKNDMATERDPIRALAERGVLHVDPETLPAFSATKNGLAKEPLAYGWEGASDSSLLRPQAASDMLKMATEQGYDRMLNNNQWLNKVPGDALVHEAKQNISDRLGFNHLMDELRNATNPNSGLPAHLLLDPKSLDRVSVPQAVERVAAINEWRAAQKAEADMARANNAATVLHKEYPEAGFKWVELKKGKLPDDWAEEFVDTDLGKLRKFRDPKTGGLTATDPTEEALRAALKYEGDTMGHCVGGYCDDVASGATRIYSLRDAKGQPHVTVEVKPKGAVFSDVAKHIGREEADRLLDQGTTLSEMIKGIPDFKYPESIIQIKGKGNKKPNDEYLPFVQDFVKSGKWSDVGDLGNAGLHNGMTATPWPKWYTNEDVDLAKKAFGRDPFSTFLEETQSKYAAPQDFEAWLGANAGRLKGYATGGTVTAAPAPTWLDTYNSWVNQHKGQFGGQDMNRAWDADPDAAKQKTALDDTYLAALDAYNKANGTNLAPDSAVLGASAQPNTFTPTDHSRDGFFGHAIGAIGDTLKDPSKGLTNLSHDIAKNPLANAALTAAGSYFGLPPALTAALLGANRTGLDGDIGAGLKTGIASYGAGKLMPDLGWGQAAQSAVGNTVSSLLNGNNIGDSIKNAGISYVGGQAGAEAKDLTGSDFAGKAANSLTQTALKGKDIGSTLDQLATQYASGQLTDLSGMDPKMAAIVVNLARNKKSAATGIATGALTQAAQRAVGSTKLSDLAVGS